MSQIFNLFGYFGSINKILFKKHRNFALIEFANREEAQKCIDFLHKMRIHKTKLGINYSHSEKIEISDSFLNNAQSRKQYWETPKAVTNSSQRLLIDRYFLKISSSLLCMVNSSSVIHPDYLLSLLNGDKVKSASCKHLPSFEQDTHRSIFLL